jgi:CheY-like chemotaxis protein/HPt (histidine-containing phosphotransfer) domain-containing protein
MKKIAVIEDNPDNRLLVQVILDPHFEIAEYETGFAGLEGLKKQRPDIVLLDISLPGMDGPEVLQHIREDNNLKSLPVIALTAHAMAGDRQKYLDLGFDEYVTKPIVDESILLGAIQKLLAGSSAATAPAAAPATSEIDPALENLKRLGGPKFAIEMIDLFFEYTQAKLSEARKAFTTGNPEGVAKAVHPIKSSAGNVGATQVQNLAEKIERSAHQQPVPNLDPLLAEIEAAYAEIKPKLESFKKNLKAGL